MAVTEQPGRWDANTDYEVSSGQIKPVGETTEEDQSLSLSLSLSILRSFNRLCIDLQRNENHTKKFKFITTATLNATGRNY
jgi:hypothetical protein